MKLSLSWIKDYVDLSADLDLDKLSYDLTMSTVEVEEVIDLGAKYKNVVVGKIEEVLPHPNADKLRICKTDIGGEVKEIVCGGINLEAGMKVVVACPGAFVRWHGEGEPVEIKNAKLRGVQSFGMICASDELELGDLFPAEEAEIMDITSFDAEPGTPIAQALGLDDIILDIDNKSMTNRPDLWGHYGMARELAAIYKLPIKPIENYVPEVSEKFDARINAPERCRRFIGTAMEGVDTRPAPYWMQSRLWKVGQRPISALVDITNYVMMAVGQPTHVYDMDVIKDHIEVRCANDNEKLLLLNGKELSLSHDDLVIADAEGAVGLAGVMGGSKDSILPTTSRTILEIANFEATGVRRTALRYDNRTEASSRYEKAIDTQRCDQALALSMQLFKQLFPDVKVTAFNDVYPTKTELCEIDVSADWLKRRLGKNISDDEISAQLGRLGFETSFDGDNIHVIVPSWRSTGDVSIKADIMEEVARMYGYDNFEPTDITATFSGAVNQLDKDLDRRIREYLAFRCGMQEVFTYPWMKDKYINAVLQSTDGMLTLACPPAPDEKYIRSSLLPNLCETVVKNQRYFENFSIFEVTKVFKDQNYKAIYDERELLPEESKSLAAVFVDSRKNVDALYRKAKGIVENMPRYTHMEAYEFCRCEKPVWADDTAWFNVCIKDKCIGNFAILSNKAALDCGIKDLAVVIFELDMESLVPFRSRTNKFVHLQEYPLTEYDVSLLFESSVKWQEIEEAVRKNMKNNALVKDVEFIGEYKGKQVPEGKKSITIRLIIGSEERTLQSKEIDEAADKVINALNKKLGGEMRTK